jgi:hypothetical protein
MNTHAEKRTLKRFISYSLACCLCNTGGTATKTPSHKEKVSDMENIYHISEAHPNLLVDEIGMIEDGYHPSEMDDSLLRDLSDSEEKKRIEYRHYQRFQLGKDAFALIRSISAAPLKITGKSMGCIACAVFNARPAKLGKIDNISMGGLMFHHADSKAQLSQAVVLDILLADCGFYLANIAFKTITDVVIPDEVSSDAIEIRQVRLQFQQLNAIKQARLKDFIMNHGTEEE